MLVVAADLHLAPNSWSRHPDLRGDSYFALHQIVDICISHKADLILPGDVFDAKKLDSSTPQVFMTEMDRLAAAGLKACAIQGQHDHTDPPWVKLHHAVEHVSGRVLALEGRLWGFYDYMDRQSLSDTLQRVPERVSVLVLHQMLQNALPFLKDDSPCWDFSFEQVPPQIKLLILGDCHRACEFEAGTFGVDDKIAVYSGTSCMQAIDENPNKSVLLISGVSVERIPLKTRQFMKFPVVNAETLEEVCNALRTLPAAPEDFPESLKKPYVVIYYQTDVHGAAEKLIAACHERGVIRLMVPVTPELVVNGKIDTDIAVETIGLESSLASECNPQTDAALYSFLRALLNAKNNAEVQGIFECKRKELGVVIA